MKNSLIFINLVALVFCLNIQASFPTVCFDEEISVPLSSQTSLGFSGEDILSNLTISQTTSFEWGDDTPTNVYLEFSPTSDFANVTVPILVNGCEPLMPEVFIDGVLSLRTEDGKLDARWVTRLSARNNETAETKLRLEEDELQGLPGRGEGEFGSTTYLRFKFQRDGIGGTIYRVFSIYRDDVPGGGFSTGQILIATIGGGIPWFRSMTLK